MSYVDELLGANGLFHRSLPDYEIREGQIRMCHAIDKTICEGGVLFAEGACGSGKSLSYLIPSILHSVQNN
jgi:ATP-dependent DNA helicase DinG